ncbi:MAG TPA: hypothetical protein VGO03_09220 [Acidimicrobiia bacterium]|jgi:hypothetical protein
MLKRTLVLGVAVAAAVGVTTVPASAASPAWVLQQPAPNAQQQTSGLASVSCSSATACTAVGGRFGDAPNTQVPEVQRWNGSAWTRQTAAAPAPLASFAGVSCPSATFCAAVGQAGESSSPLVETWDGHTWKSGPYHSSDFGQLYAVSCASATACVAVGFLGRSLLTEQWNGHGWTTRTDDFGGGRRFRLNGLTCSSASNCIGVGTTLGNGRPIAGRWNGASWTTSILAQPRNTYAQLDGVSCINVHDCYAVGFSTMQQSPYSIRHMVQHWNGSTWSIVFTPSPSGLQTEFKAVSCVTGECAATGIAFDNAQEQHATTWEPFVDRWDTHTWTLDSVQQTPLPQGILDGVSCTATKSCEAVGQTFQGGGQGETPMIDRYR